MRDLDFAAIAAAALSAAERLVAAWLPDGKRVGHEWQCGSLAGDAGDSCSVNLRTGAWADFATEDRGGDLISLYAAIHGIKQGAAARAVAALVGMPVGTDAPAHAARPAKPVAPAAKVVQLAADGWADAGPAPADAPPAPVAHAVRGKPAASWVYRDAGGAVLGYVHRFTTSTGGKEVLPCVWSRHAEHGLAWKWRAFGSPRPLYALDLLAQRPQAPVLLVEGEKCADAAQVALGDGWVATTWPGGGKAVGKAGFEPLRGRTVYLWADCDAKVGKDGELLEERAQPGVAAMRQAAAALAELGCTLLWVPIPKPGRVEDGWDVADLVAWPGPDSVAQWLERAKAIDPSGAARAGAGAGERAKAKRERPADWQAALQERRGELVRNTFNVRLILANDARWAGVVGFDEMTQTTVKRKAPPYPFGRDGEWTAEDDTRTAMWLAEHYLLDASSALVTEAIEALAREQRFHPIVDYLRSLTWDGVPRNDGWLIEYAGAPDTPYMRCMSRLFLRGMVKRVMEPGCKFDYCLVLEGAEGMRKSSLAAVLGGAWGSDTPLDLANNREASAAIAGKWVIEFSEMESVTRAEAHLQKSFLSRQYDQYRPVYGRRNIKVPRQCVFVGTTNEGEYIKEGQGARRFWPVEVGAMIDTDSLREILPQLLAEAVAEYDEGARCYPSEEEQRELFRPEQMRRVQQESLIDALHDWVLHPDPIEETRRHGNGGMFSLADAAFSALKVSYAQLTRDLQTRIGKALHALGCARVEKRNGTTRYWYMAPQKRSAASSGMPAQPWTGGDDADTPF